jgi:putative DNA methylase
VNYPKRLIEVDLPIARISAHARREKSIRHGHISTLHIWWARRPLAACRAVICAALWPDPADSLCPQSFRDAAAEHVVAFARRVYSERISGEGRLLQETASPESLARWEAFAKSGIPLDPTDANNPNVLRFALLDFIADFANWDNSTVPAYLETARALTQAAHESLGGEPGSRPLVVDPFAGGGSIPLEALRVGADAFASDLNPVAVLLNKVVLEYIPKYGKRLVDEVRKWGEWIKKEAEKELGEFYPKDRDGATPIAYLWARTIKCEGPGCGAEVPLIRSLWLAKKANRSVALQLVPNPKAKHVDFQIIVKQHGAWVNQADPMPKIENPRFDGTVKRGSATCPCCGYTTPVARVREQLKARHGGASDARLHAVVTTCDGETGRAYRLATERDFETVERAAKAFKKMSAEHVGPLSLVPNEDLDIRGIRHTWGMIYGLTTWGDFFTPRQSFMLATLVTLLVQAQNKIESESEQEFAAAVTAILSLGVSRLTDISNSLCNWSVTSTQAVHLFGRQAIPMMWDFAEASFLSDAAGDYATTIRNMIRILEREAGAPLEGHAVQATATGHPLPDDSASGFITDPPYYDAVPYAYLSDFFYVWLRRCLLRTHAELFRDRLVPKDAEIVVDRTHELSDTTHDIEYYERELARAFAEARRVLRPDGVGTIVFASKTTASWEAILKAVVDAGWIITGSWPIDTEREARVSAQGQSRLASSVHLVCRPRENTDGSVSESIGEWRDVLGQLPKRIHEWMPRLASEGVVGADAIFACLGPALEIFSRYSRVEKANGDAVPLREYLEQVWAAVSTEALSLIFADADAAGLEPDARLTAMWLWTLGGGASATNGKATQPESSSDDDAEDDVSDEEEGSTKAKTTVGYTLEFDAARKIAQGLGIHLERSESIVEVKGDKARLLPVSERTRYLFGKSDETTPPARGRKKPPKQRSFLEELDTVVAETDGKKGNAGLKPSPGETVLDRVHQAMILFAAGRGDALRRFLVEDGAGTDARFWKLAQSLSALYPTGTDEKRWVDGVLARKKGLGL